jgi:hypothetical protein
MEMKWSGQMTDDDTPMLERGCWECNYVDVLKEIKRIIHQDGHDFTDGEIIDQISGLLETGFWYFNDNKGEQK